MGTMPCLAAMKLSGAVSITSTPRLCYAKLAASCPKPPKGIGCSTGEILRCCRDLFRPCAKNSSNAKGLGLSKIAFVLRATFRRSSFWHRFMAGSSRDCGCGCNCSMNSGERIEKKANSSATRSSRTRPSRAKRFVGRSPLHYPPE